MVLFSGKILFFYIKMINEVYFVFFLCDGWEKEVLMGIFRFLLGVKFVIVFWFYIFWYIELWDVYFFCL